MVTAARRAVLFRPASANYLFYDEFDGGGIDLSKWTKTDTESKLSVSGGNLVCSGGKAAPAGGDPGLLSIPTFARAAGILFVFELVPTNTTTLGVVGIGTSGTTGRYGISTAVTAGVLAVNAAGTTTITIPFAYSGGVSLLIKVQLLAAGGLISLSSDGGLTWLPVWLESVATSTPYVLLYRGYLLPFTSSYVRVSQGSVPQPVVGPFTAANTPATGAELLTDPGLEGTYTAGLNTSLTKGGSPTVAQSADVHGGSKAQAFTATALYDQTVTYTAGIVGAWAITSLWGKRLSGTAGGARAKSSFGSGSTIGIPITSAAYAQNLATRRVLASGIFGGVFDNHASSWDAIVFDDASTRLFTITSLCDLKADSQINGVFDCQHTDANTGTGAQATRYQGGIGHWDSATPGATSSGWVAYYDRCDDKVYLDKCVAGTWTNVLAVSATYAAGATIRVVRNGTSFALYYGTTLAQLGSTSTISDAQLQTLTHWGAFRTDTSVTVAGVQHYA